MRPIFHHAFRAFPAFAWALLLCACGELIEKVPERPKQDRLNATNFVLDVDPMMRGTVASETAIAGLEPVIVRGYGLVVGLNGTGGRLMPAEVRAMMVQELARRGVGNPGTGFDISPEQMLNSLDTAVVIVEGVIPPGAIRGNKFDLRVTALPGTDVTNLEGGRLYTTDLRPGPLLIGSRQARVIAQGKGSIFINPFVEPGATSKDAVNRLVGRILDGGSVTRDLPLKLKLATSSHSRARTIQTAINSTFPRESKQPADTARGEGSDSIELTVPPSFSDKTEEFIQLIRHLPLDTTATEVTASAIRRALLANPGSAPDAMWRFRALGKRALPVLQDLYAYGEENPRMAALEAGAALDDALAAGPLIEMAKSGTVSNRIRAINLLGQFGFNPDINIGLRPLLNDSDPDIRLATSDALLKRKDPLVQIMDIDGKFDVVLVPSERRMIYISQSRRPSITLFGDDIAVNRPLTHSVWSGRLMLKSDEGDDEVQVFYLPSEDARPEVLSVSRYLSEFVPFLGHTVTIEKPIPGLGLSYGQTIGAIHSLWRDGHIDADFKAEQDRIQAAILRRQGEEEQAERPEFEPEPDSESPAAGTTPTSDLTGLEPPPAVEVPRNPRDTVPR